MNNPRGWTGGREGGRERGRERDRQRPRPREIQTDRERERDGGRRWEAKERNTLSLITTRLLKLHAERDRDTQSERERVGRRKNAIHSLFNYHQTY